MKKILFLSISLSFFCVSCGSSKFSQCQELFIKVTQATREVTTLTSSANSEDLKQFSQAADAFKLSAQTIENLKLKDPQLIEYQTNFVNIYNNYADATLLIISAKEKIDRTQANLALKKVSDTTKLEKETGEKLQAYCLNQ